MKWYNGRFSYVGSFVESIFADKDSNSFSFSFFSKATVVFIFCFCSVHFKIIDTNHRPLRRKFAFQGTSEEKKKSLKPEVSHSPQHWGVKVAQYCVRDGVGGVELNANARTEKIYIIFFSSP